MRLGKRTAVLVREALVLGHASGAQWGAATALAGEWPVTRGSYPKDSDVVRHILRDARSFRDLYPLLSKVEDDNPGDDPDAPDRGSRTLPQDPMLPVIPGTFRFERDRVAFVTYEERWHLLGPACMLPVGHLAHVNRFADGANQEVLVGVHVAERTVRHGDGEAVTYAIATIDKGGN